MTEEAMSITTTINAPAQKVFDVLADPSTHEAIDGTGWVRQPLDGKRLTETGQVFRMAMYHDNHPDKDYEMANRVEVFDPPRAIRVRRVDLAIRLVTCEPDANRSDADLRLVRGAAVHPAGDCIPAVRPAASGQLAEASG
jgi:hypothetical protein